MMDYSVLINIVSSHFCEVAPSRRQDCKHIEYGISNVVEFQQSRPFGQGVCDLGFLLE